MRLRMAAAILVLAGVAAAQTVPAQTVSAAPAAQTVPAALAAQSVAAATVAAVPAQTAAAHYVGSKACRMCHPAIYARWQKTPMANIVRDPRQHPEAIVADFSRPNPLVTFTQADIALVYGSLWKQRYFAKSGDSFYVLPAQWDIAHQRWLPYHVTSGEDWWAPLYPGSNRDRPTGPLCDGCHSVNYNIQTQTVTEWNVGCERCHGPGSVHIRRPTRDNILNPARLDAVAANDVCIQCHSQGRPPGNPIQGKYYDWPVGYQPGRALGDFWRLEAHPLGAASFFYFADGTAHKNRMQGNDFAQSVMYRRGVKCSSCHDVHGTENIAELLKPPTVLCLECHGPGSPNGPHSGSIEAHTHHAAGSTGSDCVACHMPKIEAEGVPGAYVHAHTFRFISAAMTERYKIPNPCTSCHQDQSTGWATGWLKKWYSPWRMEN